MTANYNAAYEVANEHFRANRFEAAFRSFLEAANQNHGPSEMRVGYMYSHGLGVPQNVGAALLFYQRAADRGIGEAQYNLAQMHLEGKGCQADAGRAADLYRRSAENGFIPAKYNLGLMYLDGFGVTQDPAKGAKLVHQAADEGDALAQLFIGKAYLEGEIVKKDLRAAARWLMNAAERGNVEAMYLLGLMCANGRSRSDLIAAYKYLFLAGYQNYPGAGEAWASIQRGMTAAEIGQAEKLIRQWNPITVYKLAAILDPAVEFTLGEPAPIRGA